LSDSAGTLTTSIALLAGEASVAWPVLADLQQEQQQEQQQQQQQQEQNSSAFSATVLPGLLHSAGTCSTAASSVKHCNLSPASQSIDAYRMRTFESQVL
jgi:hypothetical protein